MTDEPGGGDETVAVLDAAKKAKRSGPVDATSHSNGANVTSMMRDTISEQHSRLRDAMRRARLNETERRDVIVSLREGEVARLEMLQDLLEDVFASVPEESDLFDGSILPGNPPRLWIDVARLRLDGTRPAHLPVRAGSALPPPHDPRDHQCRGHGQTDHRLRGQPDA